MGVTRILESIRMLGSKIKFYQASTSEMFGKVQDSPQNEGTSFIPEAHMVYRSYTDIGYQQI